MKSKTASTPEKKKSPPREPQSGGTAKVAPPAGPTRPAPTAAVPEFSSSKPVSKRSARKPLLQTVVNAAKKMLKPKTATTPAPTPGAVPPIEPAKPTDTVKTPEPAKAAVPARAVTPLKTPETVPPVESKAGAAPAPGGRRKKIEPPAILTEPDAPPTPAPAGPGGKFVLGPTTAVLDYDGPEVELPEAYGTKKLFLTARDPHWLYAHWDLTVNQQHAFNAESSDGHLVLRVYGAKIEGHPVYEIHVHPESRHWFIHVERAGNSYCAELGCYSPLGKWTRIAVSSATVTPPDAASPETDVEFATIPYEFPFVKLMQIIEEAVRENLPLAQAIEELRRSGHPDLPRLKPTPAPHTPALSRSGHEPNGHPAAPVIPPIQWTAQQEQALARVICIDQSRRIWMGSLEITELIRRRLTQQVSSPAQPFGGPGPVGAAGWGAASSPAVSSPAVPFGISPPSEKSFWFNVNAELIIYGATEPGAKVTLGGQEIKLRPDGTFSYRFSLPDGKYDLPAVAVSADGTDARAADLKFSRETQYLGDVGVHPQDSSLKPPLPDNLPGNL